MDRKKRELRGEGKATAEAASTRIASSGGPGDTPGLDTPVKTDELFRHGEDLYDLGRYEDAIHVWTRILFLERGDTRTKTAIERAKRAVSERQRVHDSVLAAATRLVDAGELDQAEAKVREVLANDPRQAEAHQLMERIAARGRRKDPSSTGTSLEQEAPEDAPNAKRGLLLRVSRTSSPALRTRANTSPLKMAGFVLGVVLVFASGALFLHLNWDSIVSDGTFFTGVTGVSGLTGSTSGGAVPVDANVPGPSELHYYKGATLYAEGRYREALAELSRVTPGVAVSERTRSLILRIEDRLLRGGDVREGASDSSVPLPKSKD